MQTPRVAWMGGCRKMGRPENTSRGREWGQVRKIMKSEKSSHRAVAKFNLLT